jgi:hypothetical protein
MACDPENTVRQPPLTKIIKKEKLKKILLKKRHK